MAYSVQSPYFEESIPPAYVAWRAGTTNRVVVPARQAGNRFLGSLKGLQIQVRAQTSVFIPTYSEIRWIQFLSSGHLSSEMPLNV